MARVLTYMPRKIDSQWHHPIATESWLKMVMVMVMNDLLPPPSCNVNWLSHSEIQPFQNLTMKILGQGHVCGQRWRSRLTFKFQRSRLWLRSNTLVTFEAWSSYRYVCFLFRGNRTTFAWDIGNSIFDLENSRSRSYLMVTFEVLRSIDMVFRFVASLPFLAEI